MSWSLNIGKVAGTVVRLHITFVLFLAWIFVSNYASSGVTIAWNSLLFVVLLFLCVLLHEFGHIFTARRNRCAPDGFVPDTASIRVRGVDLRLRASRLRKCWTRSATHAWSACLRIDAR
jgi:hypothetical protein